MISIYRKSKNLLSLLASSPGRLELATVVRDTFHKDTNRRHGIRLIDGSELFAQYDFELQLRRFPYKPGNVSLYEQMLIVALTKKHLKNGDNFLEIGTFNGAVAYNIANNIPTESRVITIDLPHAQDVQYQDHSKGDEEIIRSQARQEKVHLELENVTQIYADSTMVDYSELEFNVAFIDGGHHYKIVKSDTVNILGHVARPGLIMWHDFYDQNPVTQVVREISNDLDVFQIRSTNLCFAELR